MSKLIIGKKRSPIDENLLIHIANSGEATHVATECKCDKLNQPKEKENKVIKVGKGWKNGWIGCG